MMKFTKYSKLNEAKIDIPSFTNNLIRYTAMDGEWSSGVKLATLFKDININTAKKTHSDIFEIPNKFKGANVYYFRGTSKPLAFLKKLGKPDEIIKDKFLSWNNRSYSFHEEIQSWTYYQNVAIGFAENASGYNVPPYDLKSDLPIVLWLDASKNKKNTFMNPEWLSKISKKKEGEIFHKGKKVNLDITIEIDDKIESEFRNEIKELS